MKATERRIAELIALGTEGIAALDRIPPAVAQLCARHWLMDAARDEERARARATERAAERTTPPTPPPHVARDLVMEWAISLGTIPGLKGERYEWHITKAARVAFGNGEEYAAQFLIESEAAARVARETAEREANLRIWREAVDEMIEKRASSLGIEWSAVLLTTTIAMPDGTRVEWGEATRAQHEARLDMLKKHATTELESAARHQAAIDALDAAGVDRLNDLTQ